MFARRSFCTFALLALALAAAGPAEAKPLQAGIVAFQRQDYARALAVFGPLAARGDPRAQTYLGFMYSNGYGVPQNYIEAANWLHLASEQGDARAQYLLGLMYDKGHGVPQDYVQATKWLDLAVAGATGRDRDDWVRIRDAVASKLSLAQRTVAQGLALQWHASRGR
jgi:TPR repeat protein